MLAFVAAMLLGQSAGVGPVTRSAACPGFEALARQAAAARDASHPLHALAVYRKALKLRPNWDDA